MNFISKNIILIRLYIFFIFYSFSLRTQEKIKILKKIEISNDFISLCNSEEFYLIFSDKRKKYNLEGKLIYEESNKLLGKIDWIDAKQPLKVLCYYKNFNQFIYFDSKLNQIGTIIDLNQIGFTQVFPIAASYNNGFWIFDNIESQLIRFNSKMEITNQTGNLNLLLHEIIQPIQMRESNERLFLNSKNNGIYIFDIFGTFEKRIPIKNILWFEIEGNKLYYIKENTLNMYSFIGKNIVQIPVPIEDEILTFSKLENKIIITSKKQIYICTIKKI